MMNIENIKNELAVRGIKAEQVEVVKNGISCVGFQIITNSNVRPVVYYSQNETLSSFMEKIDAAVKHLPDFNFVVLQDKDYVISNLYVTVQRRCEQDDVLAFDYLNLEAVMRLRISLDDQEERGSIKVSSSLLEMAGISIEDAWKAALNNMKSAISVRSMAAVLGMPEELFPAPFHIVTTENGVDGASALLYPEIFNTFCQQHEIGECIILPSSTQEVLVIPDKKDGICYDDFARMVNEVNNTEVDPMIRLYPVVYRYDIVSNMIKIVAEA